MPAVRKTVNVEDLLKSANFFLAHESTTEESARGCAGLIECALFAANRYKGFNIRSGFPGAYPDATLSCPFLGRFYY